MPGHDQLFKDLLEAFFPDLLSIMVPDVLAQLGDTPIDFMRGETFSDQPAGTRHTVDLLAKLTHRDAQEQLILVHVDIEHEAHRLGPERMLRYYKHLTLKHVTPVLPLAIHITGGKAGIQTQSHRELAWGHEVCRFSYSSLGLARADAEAFLNRPEPLAWALAALMKPRQLKRWQVKLQALVRIARAPLTQVQTFLLVNLVNTYAKLKGEEAKAFVAAFAKDAPQEVKKMQLTWADELEAKGEARGEARGAAIGKAIGLRASIQMLLEQRFGALPSALMASLERISSVDALQALFRTALNVQTLQGFLSALEPYLPEQSSNL